MQTLVSVIIPIYNAERYIIRCLQSVTAQTYKDFECILIDDCGTDGSMRLAEQFIHQYAGSIHFSIIHHQQNQGISVARNTGIKTATSKYIYFIDSDDAITPDCIEILVHLAQKYPEADYIQGDTVKNMETLNIGTIDKEAPEYCTEKKLLEKIILDKTHRTSWNKLIKQSFLTNNSLYFPVGILMEDHYWTYYVSKKVHAVAFSQKETYYYYRNKDSLINSPLKSSYIIRYSSYIKLVDVIIHDMLQRDDLQQYHRKFIGEALVSCMRNLAHLNSLSHWWKFWKFAFHISYQLRDKFTWYRFLLFLCMMPPCCLMSGMNAWSWRVRQYILTNI